MRPCGEDGRKKVPRLEELLKVIKDKAMQDERRLQYLLWHRRYLLSPEQVILAREVPCGFRSVRRSTVADFLAIDRLNGVPIVAEAKCATTTDSLTGVLLELLVQWCLHKSAMTALRQQFLDDGENVSDLLAQPGASTVAPASFYRETRRRSADRGRRGEITHAARMLKLCRRSSSFP